MKYLVTGATGFMGPFLIKEITDRGGSCRCLVRSEKKANLIKRIPRTEIVFGDVIDESSVHGIAEGVDTVLHLATLGHASNFSHPETMFQQVNVEGTRHIMNEALRVGTKRIIHCSSVAAMGICGEGPADESTPCNPHHPYGRSKMEAEAIVNRMVKEKGLPASIVRFSMVYGPGDWRDMYTLTKLAKKGLFPKIGSKPKLTPLIHVKDAVDALLLTAEKGKAGETYLLTNPEGEAFDQLRQLILDGMGVKRLPLYVPEGLALLAAGIIEKTFTAMGKTPPVSKKNIESTLADRIFSPQKAQNELGFYPKIKPSDGIRETVEWYKANGWI